MPLPYNYFVKTTTIVGAPLDNLTGTAPGRDPLGCNLSNATYDHAGHADGDRRLAAASGSPFTSVQAGDYIWLANAAGGVDDGLYEIASKVSSTVVLLVADDGLTADSTADVDSSRGPWLTLQYALDNATAGGSHLIICDDGNGTGTEWKYSVTLDVDTGAPSDVEPITYRGGSGRGVVDGTISTLDGSGLGYLINLLSVSNTSVKRRWVDLRFTACAIGHNVSCGDTLSVDHQWLRCRFDSSVYLAGMAARPHDWHFADCEFDNNGTWGRMPDSTSRLDSGRGNYLRCRFHDNGNGGMWTTSQIFASQCYFYDNGGPGLRAKDDVQNMMLDGCVFFGNTTDGLGPYTSLNGMAPFIATNNIFRSNGQHGIDLQIGVPVGVTGMFFIELDNNCFHNNTSGATRSATASDLMGNSSGDHNVYTDPEFVSETDGSEDFDLQDSSPCIDAGIAVPEK